MVVTDANQNLSDMADRAARLELEQSEHDVSKVKIWLEMARRLEEDGLSKEAVSARLRNIIQDRMRQIRPGVRFNARWFYKVMKKHGYINPVMSSAGKARGRTMQEANMIMLKEGANRIIDQMGRFSREVRDGRMVDSRAWAGYTDVLEQNRPLADLLRSMAGLVESAEDSR